MRNVKQVKRELKAWGNYWRFQEVGQGYAKRSACDKLGEVLTNSDAHLYENEFDIPEHIQCIDSQIRSLSHDCRRAIRAKYICLGTWTLVGFKVRTSYDYWLKNAEIRLLSFN